jgi:murein DD-endopeptidase MepM/ murein hydrolase activator NlpD
MVKLHAAAQRRWRRWAIEAAGGAMRYPRTHPKPAQRGGVLRGLLLFVAGALLGANVVYYVLNTRAPTRACPAVAPDAAPTAGSGPKAASPAVPATPHSRATPPEVSAPSPSGLVIPDAAIRPDQLVDTYTQSRGAGRLHDAIDIMAPAGTPVLAAVDGRVAKLFDSDAGGITLYQFDRDERHVYYYAHLQGYAPGIAEGRELRRGEVLGYVGSTGNASPDGPHLHFAIAVLGPDKRWHGGTPVNPYPLLSGRPAAAPTTASPSSTPRG